MQRVPMKTYDQAHADFRWEIPESFNFGADVIDKWAKDPEKLALIWANAEGDERRLTFRDVSRLSNQFASLLDSQGIGKGDRVIISLPRIPEWQIAMIGCHKLGAVPIPCVTMLTQKDIQYRIEHSDATGAITTADNTHKFEGSLKALSARISVGVSDGWTEFSAGLETADETFTPIQTASEDPAVLYYTSGSSGLPKGVSHSSGGLFSWRVSAWHWLSLTETDTMWCTADTGWAKAGTSILYGPWSCGSTVFFYDGPFDAQKRFELLEKYGVTVFCAAATELRQLIPLDTDEQEFSALRLTVSAGESVNPEIVRSWKDKTGSLLLDGYGQTETLMTILNYPEMPVKPGSMGRPLPGTDAAIIDGSGQMCEVGTIGQLAIRCPNPQIMLGYWQDEERTKQCFTKVDGVRWFVTGDTAHMDEDGYIFYDGRDDDMINSAGYRIGPMEVENALMEHSAVQECAATASPDPDRGEVVKAFVILNSGYVGDDALLADLQAHCKQLTAPYKYPRKIDFVDDLPKTVTGKIQRRVLKNREFEKLNPSI
jgi:acyl-coenzyme A synthetase/AMP-(fatty) acid ligase